MGGLELLRARIAGVGGLAAADLLAQPRPDARSQELAAIAAAGPLATSDTAYVVEAVREGHLLHHGSPRLLRGDDPDLALLVGDRCYAFGLECLAAAGDLRAIAIMSDLIALSASTAGESDVVDALWELSCSELAVGGSPQTAALRDRLRAGDSVAASELIDAAWALRDGAREALAESVEGAQGAPERGPR